MSVLCNAEGHALKEKTNGTLECVRCGYIVFGYLVKEKA